MFAGIEISKADITKRKKSLSFAKPEEPISFQVWDFAGHDDFYVTHMCFLSAFALYILVWNLDDGADGVKALSSWLNMITARVVNTAHARRLPLLIVGTHLDVVRKKYGAKADNHVARMREAIGQLLKERGDPNLDVEVVEVCCARSCLEGLFY